MKKFLIGLFLLATLTAGAQPEGWIDVTRRGAKNDGKTLVTSVIQQAIDEAAAQGGGVIFFPTGQYLTGALRLRSNITLHISSGAVLKFSDNPDDYLPFVQLRWEGTVMNSFSPLIYANGEDNITIEGRGVLDGQGKKWWATLYEYYTLRKQQQDGADNYTPYQKMWLEANPDLTVSDYYQNTIRLRFFRPPFFQTFKCTNVQIKGVKFINSPFWTINPAFCQNVTVDGVTIINPPSPNTDGINPTSCKDVHISNCHISVGVDCITIKSGRDADGRKWNTPCENITITNCTMLSGHGGVVIGSEMSGSVRKIAISNCVFDGTDNGIRMKASRERGGTVEEIRVDNIVMKNIRKLPFTFNLFYDKNLPAGPVTEKTPCFRNIHISNVTGSELKAAGHILGISEMPIQNLTFNNINMDAKTGFTIETAKDIEFHNVTINAAEGPAFILKDVRNMVFDNVKNNTPAPGAPMIELTNASNVFIYNCFPLVPTDTFVNVTDQASEGIYLKGNGLTHVKTPVANNTAAVRQEN